MSLRPLAPTAALGLAGLLAGCGTGPHSDVPSYPPGVNPAPYAQPYVAYYTGPAAQPRPATARPAKARTTKARTTAPAQPVPEPLARAIAQNPTTPQIEAQLKGKEFLDLSPDDIAALAILAARAGCDLPENAPITADTPCQPAP